MFRKIRLVAVLSLVVCVLAPLAFSAPTMIGKIILNESQWEKFGALYLPFTFQIPPQLYVLCETGIDPVTGQCLNNLVSDVICATNNSANEGVVAMMSDLEKGLDLNNLPPDFPCSFPNSQHTFFKETGKAQVLTGAGLPTTGPPIKIIATSDLDPSTSLTSDTLMVLTQR